MRVLAVRAEQPGGAQGRRFDASAPNVRMVRRANREHLLIKHGSILARLDVLSGTTSRGPVTLTFELPDNHRLHMQIAALRALRGAPPPKAHHVRTAGKLLALQAVDAHSAGASLRATADIVLGPGDWPGDGEYRKSHVRRLLTTGARMIAEGPAAILSAG